MSVDNNDSDGELNLTELAKSEQKLRGKIVAAITEFLKSPEIDQVLKVYLALGLLVLAVISSVIIVCIIHAGIHIYTNPPDPFDPILYLLTIGGLMALLIAVGFPVLSRAGSVENTLRTKANFNEVIIARGQPPRG